jgi:hypothetical protein
MGNTFLCNLGKVLSSGRRVRRVRIDVAALALVTSAGTAHAAGYYPPVPEVLGPWYGSGAPAFGAAACGTAMTAAEEFNCQIDNLVARDIPITIYLFDGSSWSLASSFHDSICRAGADCCVWGLGDAVIDRMRAVNIRAILHFWGGCHTVEHYGRAYARLGDRLMGFYLDDNSDDVEGKQVIDYLQSVMPARSEAILKAYSDFDGSTDEGLRANGNVCYVNDLLNPKSDAAVPEYLGLAEGIRRVFAKSPLLAAPFNEFTSYDLNFIPDEEQYVRRLHWGAMQPVMAQAPWRNADPWLPDYSPALVTHYRYYSWLHAELVPYLYSYVYNMHEHVNEPVIREPNAQRFTAKLGEEIFAAYVTSMRQTLDVTFPAGTWIDYWNHDLTYAGGTTATVAIPLGREPIFFRDGAIVPMRVERAYTGHGTDKSAGSLTVLVFPGRSSTFRYREHAASRWITFASEVPDAGDAFSIAVSAMPRQPILYRIERQAVEPRSIGSTAFGIGLNQGTDVPRLATEQEVEESRTNAWTYDAQAKRVIVKFFGELTDGGVDIDAGPDGGVAPDAGPDPQDAPFDASDGQAADRSLDMSPPPDHAGDAPAPDVDPPDGGPDASLDAGRADAPAAEAGPGPGGGTDGGDCDCHLGRRDPRSARSAWLLAIGMALITVVRSRRGRKGIVRRPVARTRPEQTPQRSSAPPKAD